MASTNPSKWLFPFTTTTKVLVCVGVLLFTLMAFIAFCTDSRFDERVFSSIPHNSVTFTWVMRYITYLGNTSFLIFANFLLVIFLFINKEKWVAIQVTGVAVSSVLLMSLLKRLFHRHRPPEPLIEGITNYSFPSGHAFMSLAFYSLLIWWAIIHLDEKWQQRLAIAILIGILILIGFSRIYLRVHYTTDVIAGFSMSGAWFITSLYLMTRLTKKLEARS